MARIGRNEHCPCGSGHKAKRCCGVERGPAPPDLANAFLAAEARAAALVLAGVGDDELEDLWERMLDAPASALSLHFPLPKLATPELTRLLEAIEDGDDDDAEDALACTLERLDSVVTRAALAKAVLALRDAGTLSPRVAALALLDLDSSSTAFVRASLAEAAAVDAGSVRTPGGLLVAHRLAA